MATWSKSFSLEGEELSYIISITNTASGIEMRPLSIQLHTSLSQLERGTVQNIFGLPSSLTTATLRADLVSVA